MNSFLSDEISNLVKLKTETPCEFSREIIGNEYSLNFEEIRTNFADFTGKFFLALKINRIIQCH